MTDLKDPPFNRDPLNQAAKRWLLAARAPANPHPTYLLQLLNEGFEQGLPLPGPDGGLRADLAQAAGLMLNQAPDRFPKWLLSNPNGPASAEQSQTLLSRLETAPTWQEAAQALMETFSDRATA